MSDGLVSHLMSDGHISDLMLAERALNSLILSKCIASIRELSWPQRVEMHSSGWGSMYARPGGKGLS